LRVTSRGLGDVYKRQLLFLPTSTMHSAKQQKKPAKSLALMFFVLSTSQLPLPLPMV
jgi:hypothetical protein